MFLVGILIMPFTLFVAATIVRQRRSPASSVTWLLTILFMPLVGIPLFWLFGTRKIDRIARTKPPVELTPQDAAGPDAAHPAMMRAAADLGSQGITRGNALKFHSNGEEAFADLMALIDRAQKSISIETYELKGDETGKAIVDRLIARATSRRRSETSGRWFRIFLCAAASPAEAQTRGSQDRVLPAYLARNTAQQKQPARPSQDRRLRQDEGIRRRAQSGR